MLLGRAGLLSFGHAVYFGLGGYAAMHAMQRDRGRRRVLGRVPGLRRCRWWASPSARWRRGHRLAVVPAGGHPLRDDLARHRRAGRLGGLHVHLRLRRRGGDLGRPDDRARALRPVAGPDRGGLLVHRLLDLRRRGGDVRLHPHAARQDERGGARQPGAGGVHRLRPAAGSLPGVHRGGRLRGHGRRHGGGELRDLHPREPVAARRRARSC